MAMIGPSIRARDRGQGREPAAGDQLAASYNVPIQYDTKAQAPFYYTAADGKQHEVWFEDARSIQAKFNLIKELKIRGMSYWKLGLSFPQNWLLFMKISMYSKGPLKIKVLLFT